MFRFLTRAFAVIGFLVVLVIVLGIVGQRMQAKKALTEPEQVILNLNFDSDIVEHEEPSPLSFALNDKGTTTLFDIMQALDNAKDDPHVKGVVAHFGGTQPSFAHAQEILAALKRFRECGKFTYAFGSTYGEFGLGNRTYYLASAFENIWLQPIGSVALTGLGVFSPFGKTALDKLGVTADFMQREEYKSFMDMAKRDDFAPPVRANMQALVDNLAEQEAREIADNLSAAKKMHEQFVTKEPDAHGKVTCNLYKPAWDTAYVKGLMAKGPYTDTEACEAGLITHIGYRDELDEELKKRTDKDVRYVSPSDYLSFIKPDKTEPKAKVALIFGSGMILDHEVGGVDGLTGEKIMGADKVSDAFDAASHDKDVKAILFRINSPGGSPSASETVRRAMIHAQKAGKPVIVSMGDMAASGGYWIAMNADEIIAEPGTLTGSIGVISGKFSAKDLLQKLGVNVDSVRTADNVGMWLPIDQFTPMQRERVNALMDNSYRAFTQNVAAARKIPVEKMPDIAKGRVFTGEQASKIGLVDELGGYTTTFAAIRKKLKLGDNDLLALQLYPRPETPVERLQKLFHTLGVEGAMAGSALSALHQLQLTFAPFASELAVRNMPVAARMPNVPSL